MRSFFIGFLLALLTFPVCAFAWEPLNPTVDSPPPALNDNGVPLAIDDPTRVFLTPKVIPPDPTPQAVGIDREAPQGDNARLLKAAEVGNVSAINELLANGADPNTQNTGEITHTALMLAANGGHTEAVHALVDAGAWVNALAHEERAGGMREGVSALTLAVHSGNVEIVNYLLAQGANTKQQVVESVRMNDGSMKVSNFVPIIHFAPRPDVAQALTQKGIKLDEKDSHGATLLSKAEAAHNKKMLTFLKTQPRTKPLAVAPSSAGQQGIPRIGSLHSQGTLIDSVSRAVVNPDHVTIREQSPSANGALKKQ